MCYSAKTAIDGNYSKGIEVYKHKNNTKLIHACDFRTKQCSGCNYYDSISSKQGFCRWPNNGKAGDTVDKNYCCVEFLHVVMGTG